MVRLMCGLAFALALPVATLGAADPDAAMRDALTGMSHDHAVMTELRPARPDDRARAAAAVAGAKAALAHYPTVAAAEAAGYSKYLPLNAFPIEHYADQARWKEELAGRVDYARPSALLFERKNGTLRPVAVMYVAALDAAPAALDAVVPLSVARWHRHVDICLGPSDDPYKQFGTDPRFGFGGTIVTDAACQAAGGRWLPAFLGWMVHVWPNERDPWGAAAHDRAMPAMNH